MDGVWLEKWQEDAFRQSVETAVILEWRMRDYSNRRVESKPVSQPVSEEQKQAELEKFRHLENQLAGLTEEKESEGE